MESSFDARATGSEEPTAFWSGLAASGDRETFFASWLALQCSRITACRQGVLALAEGEDRQYLPVAAWPEIGQDSERLADILEQTLAEQEGLLVPLEAAGGSASYGLAYPIVMEDECVGAVAVEV
ncbi:MAG: hypothetical protein ACOC3F_02970, partial [Desulfosudaceae bacterium]